MNKPDSLTLSMQNQAIEIASERLGHSLSDELRAKICQPWSYMGLEMIIDTVQSIEISELENYLSNLE